MCILTNYLVHEDDMCHDKHPIMNFFFVNYTIIWSFLAKISIIM